MAMMYGKSFASMYQGSMVGAGINVFAVWNYAISNASRGYLEINPVLLAMILGGREEDITKALEYLTRPDPKSRSKEEDGRRLVREGQFLYRVVNWHEYQKIRNEDERREYNRRKQSEYRARKAHDARKKQKGGTFGETLADRQSRCDHKFGEDYESGGVMVATCPECKLTLPSSELQSVP